MTGINRIAAAATPAEKLHEAICSLRDVAEWLREQGEDDLADEADMVADQVDSAFKAEGPG